MLSRIMLAAILLAMGALAKPLHSKRQSPLDPNDHEFEDEPEIAAFCITQDLTATTEEFTAATEKYCHDMSSKGINIATGDHYTESFDCNGERCITLSLYFKCLDHNNAPTHGLMHRHTCNEYFELPWANGETCWQLHLRLRTRTSTEQSKI
ncbi:hypothetical protein DOTSEDRAFT_56651 [Dothistroma septosporum NZE10]|uniref:Cyanovirin-N domain-containing protein n=1 Tax=Dothistroma septosporum (strain NZE10 / CBS 128990) TaxID=675120 RepID=M2XI83_DOTSN|nr:hypothetical protein DOTSEDRAFT_56651 [Dothistroma septosporum NZE10]